MSRGLSNVIAIAVGGFQSLALTATDSVVEWGASATMPNDLSPASS
jgi:hypothetical protein